MGKTNFGFTNMDVIMDATQAAAKMTGQGCDDSATQHVDRPPTDALPNQGEVMMFHIDTGTPQDEDQDRLLWQKRPACNWNTGKWISLSVPASQLAPIRDLRRRAVMKEVRGVMMPVLGLETDKMSQSQRQTKLKLKLKLPGTDRLSLGHEDRVGNVTKETRPRVAVGVAVLTANKDSMGEMRKYNGLLVYNNRDFAKGPADKPLLGWVIAETPQAVRRGRYMALLVYKERLNMIILGHELGRRIIYVCHAADETNNFGNTID